MGFGFRRGSEQGQTSNQTSGTETPKRAAMAARRGGNAIVATSRRTGNNPGRKGR